MKKTQQKGSKSNDKAWMKWAYVGVALLFAVAMVGTYFSPMFNKGQAVQAGNVALIGYTIRGEDGRPLITTDQGLLEREYQKGNYNLLLSRGMEIPAGIEIPGEEITAIPIVHPPISGFSGFSLLGFEITSMSGGIAGMRPGEMRTISFSYGENRLEASLSEEDAEGLGLNFTEWEVGDLIPLGLTTSPEIPVGNDTPETPALRFGRILAKTPDSLAITYRYGSADITLNSIVR
ncbi:MAG: hypothetical protein GX882_03430 [Methanomicrobiales archaeon]|nr:hypothetical protein [Methanomicrobiales archaeon]